MELPRILIISPEHEAYARLLAEHPVTVLPGGEGVDQAYKGEPVVLGEPDLVAAALPDMPGVRWVQSTWAGVELLMDAARNGIVVTGVKDVFGPQMAEYAIGYMLARELDIFGRFVLQHAREWKDYDTGGLQGKTLGVMGTGSIGACIARRAAGFGMRILGFNRSGKPEEGFEEVFGAHGLHEFLARADYLVSVLPDTPATTHLLDSAAFRAMPAHSYLINVGRGNVVDETALTEALNSGQLAGAVLDVFQQEPLPEDHPFWNTSNLLITAHVAARSYPEDIARIFEENYRRFSAGKSLQYVIDPELGY